MLALDRKRFGPITATLRDGRALTLRWLGSRDGEALAEFYQAIPPEAYRFYRAHRLTRAEALQRMAEQADAPTFVCLLAETPDARIAGYAWYEWKDPDSPASTFGICIRPGWQSGGLGRALMARLLEVAADLGPPRMELTVQLANAGAIALYTKMGFRIVGQQVRNATAEFPAEPEYAMARAVREE